MNAGFRVLSVAFLLAATAFGGPELKWYASRSAVVCLDVLEQGARLRVKDASGRVAFEGGVEGPRVVVPVGRNGGSLPNGSYSAELVCDKVVVCSHDFIHTNYPWFNSPVGKVDILLPGFAPLKVKGEAIEAVGRKYVFERAGLLREVWTLGKQILARPVALKMKASAKIRRNPFAVEGATDTKVSFRTAFAAGRVEQDGLIVLMLKLPETEGDVSLEIPIKKEYAQFFHVCGDAIRSNPAGALPAGGGRIFGSRSMGGCV